MFFFFLWLIGALLNIEEMRGKRLEKQGEKNGSSRYQGIAGFTKAVIDYVRDIVEAA